MFVEQDADNFAFSKDLQLRFAFAQNRINETTRDVLSFAGFKINLHWHLSNSTSFFQALYVCNLFNTK